MSIHFKESKTLPFAAQKLFALVADVESYPRFIKGCQALKVLTKTQKGCRAQVTAGMGFFSESYTCDVVFNPPTHILVESIEGPFKAMKNSWTFDVITPSQTKVTFEIDLEFSSSIQQFFMEGAFANFAKDIMLSFETEAQQRFPVKAS